MPVSPARAAAFDILLRVERENSYASELLHTSLYERLSIPDHALLTELVMGAIRWRSVLDRDIAHASSQPLARLDLEILIALRLAVYQFRWLHRIPSRAALHESVELVKRARKRSAAPFVNAVLRKLSTNSLCSQVPSVAKEISPQTIAETQAHPAWLVERWTATYGLATTNKICQHNQAIPATAIRLRNPNAEQALVAEGVKLSNGRLMSSARIVDSGKVAQSKPLRTGQVAIQDEASQLVAALVGKGERILDCCAAPGGKTLAMSDCNHAASITAVELHPHRARLLRKLTEAGNTQIEVLAADARHLPLSGSYHRVLADVPCSGTGTLARNPEIKWRLRPEDLADLQQRQLAILQSAMAQVAPGGRLVYSTCSLEKEENEDVLQQALQQCKNFRAIPCAEELDRLKKSGELTWPDPASLTTGPYLRTIPGIHPCDGFFAAILEKS